ncbi:hypothetical protein M9H77_16452 [Catharanthus roseus]|uniref:Uncharacterized protein n=1 Tax=Catharanthus roseus TaxID=4058 RepID=A0ACC0B1T8_CATRO|nr:hypothetical protein M9H77_16452 [Catharanthus roseus]
MTAVWFHLICGGQRRVIRQFARAQRIRNACDTRLDLHRIQLRGNDHTYWGTQHASHVEAWHQWQLRVNDGPALAVKVLSLPWQLSGDTGATYISVTDGYFREESVDDHSEYDIQQTFPVQPSRRRPREHVPDRDARGVKRGTRRQPGCGAGGGRPPVPHFPGHVEMERCEGSGQVERGEGSKQVERDEGSGGGHPLVNPFDSPILDIPSFSLSLTQPSQSLPGGSVTLRAPPPTTGSSTLHQSISQASSSDDEERADDTDDVQRFGFRHRVGKKTTRFTLSD